MSGNESTAHYVAVKQSIYREYSHSYDEDRARFVGAEVLAQRVRWALDPFDSRKRLLDAGCGSGDLLLQAMERARCETTMVGLDLIHEMLRLARGRLGKAASLVEGNVLDGLPFQSRSFHLLTSLNLVQELPAPATLPFLAEVHRVLQPGGTFRAVVPCMSGNNPSAEAFRELARTAGEMEFLFAEDLKRLLAAEPSFSDKELRLVSSPAASASASGATRFKFFAGLMEELRQQGLDPGEVRQAVVFFSGRRNA
jgi:ubiquinone/menaquinone biosynthesis C-methylase UbiE